MNVDIQHIIELLGNGTAVGVIIFWIIDSFRKWFGEGGPELKLLKEDLKQTHEDIRALISKL